jgi:hypothetical protein
MSLLELPLELRLIVYGHAAVEGAAVTIGAVELTGTGADIVHRQYGDDRSPLPGLPRLHEPAIYSGYSSRLLSVSHPARLDVSSPPKPTTPHSARHSTLSSLMLLNHQINAELTTHILPKKNRNTSLFIQFPLGLHVFKTRCPNFLRQARSIHIAGSCSRVESCQAEKPPHLEQLAQLVLATLGQSPPYPIDKLEARIYFPGNDSYPRVWGDSSPASVILHNVFGGFIDMEVARGRHGTGVHVSVRPHPENKRVISTVWRRLVEGDGNQPECGDWAVDRQWPEWTTEFAPSSPLP